MTNPNNRARGRVLAGLALLVVSVVALIAVACAQQGPGEPAATSTVPSTDTTARATQAPSGAATQPAQPVADAEVGVDAEGNFYRGDPNAPVKLVEFSDFQ